MTHVRRNLKDRPNLALQRMLHTAELSVGPRGRGVSERR